MLDAVLQAVAREPERDQRIVMRPDRAVMIGHRIVAGLVQRDGADAPAREEMRPQQIDRDLAGTVLADHAAEQEMPGVRRAPRARLLFAVQRQGVGAELLAPESVLKALGQVPRL